MTHTVVFLIGSGSFFLLSVTKDLPQQPTLLVPIWLLRSANNWNEPSDALTTFPIKCLFDTSFSLSWKKKDIFVFFPLNWIESQILVNFNKLVYSQKKIIPFEYVNFGPKKSNFVSLSRKLDNSNYHNHCIIGSKYFQHIVRNWKWKAKI